MCAENIPWVLTLTQETGPKLEWKDLTMMEDLRGKTVCWTECLCPPKIHMLNPNAQGDGHYLELGALGGD